MSIHEGWRLGFPASSSHDPPSTRRPRADMNSDDRIKSETHCRSKKKKRRKRCGFLEAWHWNLNVHTRVSCLGEASSLHPDWVSLQVYSELKQFVSLTIAIINSDAFLCLVANICFPCKKPVRRRQTAYMPTEPALCISLWAQNRKKKTKKKQQQ